MRFYGPAIVQQPGWLLNILTKCLRPLQAEEATWQANAVRTGGAVEKAYRKQMEKWRTMARPVQEQQVAVIDPKAEQWFKDNGIPYRLAADGNG